MIPAEIPPMKVQVKERDIKCRYPRESSVAASALRKPLQHMPIAVKTAMALLSMMPLVIISGMRPSAAPTVPKAVIGKATSSLASKPKSQ